MWVNRIVSSACARLGLRFRAVYDESDFDNALIRYIDRERVDFLSYGNADIEFIRDLPAHKGFHIIRDPRDIVVSAYFSHLHSHSTSEWPELIEYREKLRSVSKDEGLLMEIDNRASEFRHLSTWDYDCEDVLEVRFEEIVRQPYDGMLRVFEHLELLDESRYRWSDRAKTLLLEVVDVISRSPHSRISVSMKPDRISGAELLGIVWRNRFQAQTAGRKQGQEKLSSHYRKGQPGDWMNHFNEEHRQRFKERYAGLLEQLGYESDDGW